jgi:hypothetical protein
MAIIEFSSPHGDNQFFLHLTAIIDFFFASAIINFFFASRRLSIFLCLMARIKATDSHVDWHYLNVIFGQRAGLPLSWLKTC